MIKNISELKKHSPEYIDKFLRCCYVREKIDAYYLSVEIRTKRLIFRKANKREVTREDMILNSMYGRLAKDWDFFRMANDEWFADHRGFIIYMFYLPCRKPVLTEYVSGTSYIIDRIEAPDGRIISGEETVAFCELSQTDKFGIKRLPVLKKTVHPDFDSLVERIKQDDMTWIDDFIDFQNSEIFAAGVPEGYMFRYADKCIMQYICNETGDDLSSRKGSAEKAQFEYLLMDFVHYWDSIDDLSRFVVSGDYVKTVCNMFNDYIENCERYTHKIEQNVDEQSLDVPCVGTRFDMGFDYIPDVTTRRLCQESTLYQKIFKILLVNLRREKKHELCVLMNKDKVKEWNVIVQTLKNLC